MLYTTVASMTFIYLYVVYYVSVDPDIEDNDNKQVVVTKMFVWSLEFSRKK